MSTELESLYGHRIREVSLIASVGVVSLALDATEEQEAANEHRDHEEHEFSHT